MRPISVMGFICGFALIGTGQPVMGLALLVVDFIRQQSRGSK